MINFLKEELGALGQFCKSNGKEVIIVTFSILFICLNEYNPIGNDTLSTFLYYAVFPLLVILIILRKNPLDYGLKWGSPRVWWPYVLITCVIAAVVLYASSFDASLKDYYIASEFSMFTYFLIQCVSLSAQEFMFRGVLLFGLKDKLKRAPFYCR